MGEVAEDSTLNAPTFTPSDDAPFTPSDDAVDADLFGSNTEVSSSNDAIPQIFDGTEPNVLAESDEVASNVAPPVDDAEITSILNGNEVGTVEALNEPFSDVGSEATVIPEISGANSPEVFADLDESLSDTGTKATNSDVQTTTILDGNESEFRTSSKTPSLEIENEGSIHPAASIENPPELSAEPLPISEVEPVQDAFATSLDGSEQDVLAVPDESMSNVGASPTGDDAIFVAPTDENVQQVAGGIEDPLLDRTVDPPDSGEIYDTVLNGDIPETGALMDNSEPNFEPITPINDAGTALDLDGSEPRTGAESDGPTLSLNSGSTKGEAIFEALVEDNQYGDFAGVTEHTPTLGKSADLGESVISPTPNESEPEVGASVINSALEAGLEPSPSGNSGNGNPSELNDLSVATSTDTDRRYADVVTAVEEALPNPVTITGDVPSTATLDASQTNPLDEMGSPSSIINMNSDGFENVGSPAQDSDIQTQDNVNETALSGFDDSSDLGGSWDLPTDTDADFMDVDDFVNAISAAGVSVDGADVNGDSWDLPTDTGDDDFVDVGDFVDATSVDGAYMNGDSLMESSSISAPLETSMDNSPIVAEPVDSFVDDYMPIDSPF